MGECRVEPVRPDRSRSSFHAVRSKAKSYSANFVKCGYLRPDGNEQSSRLNSNRGTPMLDPAMQQFADQMRARPRPPRRSSTRQAEQIDNLSAPGAQRLSEMIRSFWSAAGFDNIRTEIVHSGGSPQSPAYGVRSNLRNALPPQGLCAKMAHSQSKHTVLSQTSASLAQLCFDLTERHNTREALSRGRLRR